MASNKETVNSAAETCKFLKPTKFNVMYNYNCYKKTSTGISIATIISTIIALAGSSSYVRSQFMFYVHVYTTIAKVL